MERDEAIQILKSNDPAITNEDRRDATVALIRSGEEWEDPWGEGVEEWNRLRKEARERHPDATRGNQPDDPSEAFLLFPWLVKADFFKAKCGGADFSGANCWEADFSEADCEDADFSKANCWIADFSKARCRKANFSGANCSVANFNEAKLRYAQLDEVNLFGAKLAGANLALVKMQRADLSHVHFGHVDDAFPKAKTHEKGFLFATAVQLIEWHDDFKKLFSRSHFEMPLGLLLAFIFQMLLTYVRMWAACLRPAFILDATWTQETVLPADPRDPWTVLRRSYTGPMFAFHLLLLVVFILPVAGRAVFWSGLHDLQERTAPMLESVSEKGHAMAQRIDAERLETQITDRLSGDGEKQFIFMHIVGLTRGPFPFMIFLCAAIYNGMRVYLTWKVGILRDREEQTGRSPEHENYKRLVTTHLIANTLTIFTLTAAGIDFVPLLFHTI